MNSKKHKRLSLKERIIIETLLKENKSKSFIAKRLNRSRSTITREVNKWVTNPNEKYDASLADWLAKDDYLNKRNRDKIQTHSLLRFYVYKGLLKNWSPEQIAGRIKLDYPNNSIMSISHEAIYMHIYSHPQASLNKKLIKLLPYQKSRRRKPKPRRKKGSETFFFPLVLHDVSETEPYKRRLHTRYIRSLKLRLMNNTLDECCPQIEVKIYVWQT